MDLFVNAVLTASSVALFCNWFRYTCLLILAAETPRDHSEQVAEANNLAFLEVREDLRKHDAANLDRLHNCLAADFAILARLRERINTAMLNPGLEDVMLMIHFRTISTCFRLTRNHLQGFALDALEEMSVVVVHLANQLGERQATAA